MIPKINLQEIITKLQKFKENDDKKLIGIFPHSLIPDELIYAANAIPIKLTLGGDEYATTKGTEYLTQATCPFARGTIGYFDQANPLYQLLDACIGGNFCNGDLCASEMIMKFFNIPFIRVTFPTTTAPFSLNFLKKEFILLKEKLESLTGNQITRENLYTSIELYNQIRNAFDNINKQLKKNNSPLMGEDLHYLIHRFFLLGPDEMLNYINQIEMENAKQIEDKIPVLLSGSGIALGDELIHLIEEFNVRLVVNDTWSGIHFYHEKIDINASKAPLDILANHYLLKNESSRMVPNTRRIPRVLNLVKEYDVKGVINHILKFCDPYVADRIRFKEALQEADIPTLELERDYSTSIEQLKTRLGAFFEMISYV